MTGFIYVCVIVVELAGGGQVLHEMLLSGPGECYRELRNQNALSKGNARIILHGWEKQ